MRLFLTALILIFSFQSFTKADNISEYEIEGMSVGDSLLDYFSKNEINESLKNPSYYKNKKFVEVFINYKNSEFDFLQVAFEPNDKIFIIEKIMLVKDFPDQIEKCKKYKKNLINESSNFLSASERIDENKAATVDPTGNSFRYISTFYYHNGGFINFSCTDYGKEMYEKHGWMDSFTASVGSDKIMKFLQSSAH